VVCIGSDIEDIETEDTANSGLHTSDDFNQRDEQGRVLGKNRNQQTNINFGQKKSKISPKK